MLSLFLLARRLQDGYVALSMVKVCRGNARGG